MKNKRILDRHCNILKVEKSNNGELHIHFRNLKIAVLNYDEQQEWLEGFRQAKANLGDYFRDDI